MISGQHDTQGLNVCPGVDVHSVYNAPYIALGTPHDPYKLGGPMVDVSLPFELMAESINVRTLDERACLVRTMRVQAVMVNLCCI